MDDKDRRDLNSLFNDTPFNEDQDFISDDFSTNNEDIEVLSLNDEPKIDPEVFKTDENVSEVGDMKFKVRLPRLKDINISPKRLAIFLVIVAGILSLWYAFFAQPLAFNAKQLISKKVKDTESNGSWDIKFTNIVQGDVIGFAKELSTPSLSSTKASFYLSLSKPGDSFTYKITIRNGGTINAKVSDIIIIPQNTTGDAVLYHVNGVQVDDFLDAGKETVVSVTAEYNPEHLGPAIPVAKNVTVLINYVQRS